MSILFKKTGRTYGYTVYGANGAVLAEAHGFVRAQAAIAHAKLAGASRKKS